MRLARGIGVVDGPLQHFKIFLLRSGSFCSGKFGFGFGIQSALNLERLHPERADRQVALKEHT